MTVERLSVSVPSFGWSNPVDLAGRELIGAYLLSPTSWTGGNRTCLLQIAGDATTPGDWLPLPNLSLPGADYPFDFGASNARVYAPVPMEIRDLPAPIRVGGLDLPSTATVILVVRTRCAITITGC